MAADAEIRYAIFTVDLYTDDVVMGHSFRAPGNFCGVINIRAPYARDRWTKEYTRFKNKTLRHAALIEDNVTVMCFILVYAHFWGNEFIIINGHIPSLLIKRKSKKKFSGP